MRKGNRTGWPCAGPFSFQVDLLPLEVALHSSGQSASRRLGNGKSYLIVQCAQQISPRRRSFCFCRSFFILWFWLRFMLDQPQTISQLAHLFAQQSQLFQERVEGVCCECRENVWWRCREVSGRSGWLTVNPDHFREIDDLLSFPIQPCSYTAFGHSLMQRGAVQAVEFCHTADR